ncbi:succinate dehydrogenase, cytochrome b556 subunit [Salipiger bermudensis]|uniref:Succinate dehydrogenase cytochrome b556 subunit n=1 Tax=Salipiger bermudensis (strain DSM 26914 / JCM 13377 / KCTC 12554 / HTCC2601) TaxID=314265 RepID=Q0FNG3_SALBH|nr:succinate dehydrogenase, cytochrome b556 subunit [Salipiger bermudensis]MAE88640.1 succinate dehydrogenase, cytochrome b556 subunit [Pelagibaca sp.]MBR9891028.1 succinate dehydrogenase, cytochrome b556 subunit [bacterium]EAU45781.1 Succinate dehydrogenase cytochrome b-556 subunit [Salipiger bermudensis HTCC2601]MBN9676572.1 succinate dehydrogenase, cytochrome b556 subunit [Salipiger bermudensis]MCA1287312.1 succinate dehydrogenase, cytochrome b556 subunit [Salipiger bermudensis]
MAEAKRIERPLSPFMFVQYYRLQLTAVTSVMIRITGNALMVATLLVIWWLLALAAGPEAFETAEWWITSWVGNLVMFGSLWAVWYHYLGGLRHLIFDAGKGLELETAEKLGWACVYGSVVLTVLTVIIYWI